MTGYIRKRRDELVFNEWQNYLVAKAEIHNLKSDAEMAELDQEDRELDEEAADEAPAGEAAARPDDAGAR